MADGLQNTMKPRQLYESRPEYQIITIETFRKHIYQEGHRRDKEAARSARKQQKEAKKNARRAKEHTNHAGWPP
jgi:hypothetical protein